MKRFDWYNDSIRSKPKLKVVALSYVQKRCNQEKGNYEECSNINGNGLGEKIWNNSARNFVGDHALCLHFETGRLQIERHTKQQVKDFLVWDW